MTIMGIIRGFIRYFNYFCMSFTLLLCVIYLLQLVIAFFKIRRNRNRQIADDYLRYADSDNLLPISLIIPAFNEQENIVHNVKSLMKLSYPEYEIIVVNDGSTDQTHYNMVEAFGLYPIETSIKISIPTEEVRNVYYNKDYPNLIYIDKASGGKSDALNAGINASSYPLFACLDADSRLEKDALLHLGNEFLKDTTTVVAGGLVRIANGSKIEDGVWQSFEVPRRHIERLQIVEYFRSFLSGRVCWGNGLLIVSGAFGVFNKQAVIDCGGYKRGTVGEGMEIVMHVHKEMVKQHRKYSVKFCPEAVCWTQGPMNSKDLRSQRRRWQVGLVDTLFSYFHMTFNFRYKVAGLLAVPYNWLFEFLGAIVEVLGYFIIPFSLIMGELNGFFFVMYLLLSVLLGVILSVGGIILEQYMRKGCMSAKQAMKLSVYAILENLGYRQMIMLARVGGILRFRRLRNLWGKIQRKEFNK